MSNTANNRFPRNNSSGVQRRPRDVARMADFLEEKEISKPGGWASSVEVSEQYLERAKQNSGRQQRNQTRAGNWKKKSQAKPDAAPIGEETNRFKSTKSTEPVVDQLYNVTQGSRQNVRIRSQNIEHSSYPLLCDVVYRQLHLVTQGTVVWKKLKISVTQLKYGLLKDEQFPPMFIHIDFG